MSDTKLKKLFKIIFYLEKYNVDELLERDKTSLDISWIKDKDDLEDVTLKELFSTIQQKGQNINNAINQLAGLLSGIEE